MKSPTQWIGLIAFCATAGSSNIVSAAAIKGPSSSQTPYVVPVASEVSTTSLLTVGDSVNLKPDGKPYRMVGIPDGMGAYDNGDETFTVLMNHELPPNAGVTRAHGATGAFVSRWIIRKDDLSVVWGDDLIQQVSVWNQSLSRYNAPQKGITIGRLCSADLPPVSAFYSGGVGYNGRLLMNGEETGNEGRAFAHTMYGMTYELPRLGRFSWENSLANPATGRKTVVIGTDDSTPGQVYVYVGDKTSVGNPVERAGLTNGSLFGIKVIGHPSENRVTGIPSGTQFTLHEFGNVENVSGAGLQGASTAFGVTEFLRPEDGHWDAKNPSHFYFVTTDRFDQVKSGTGTQVGRSRLWRLRFYDVTNPAAGGQIDMLLDGTEPQQMMDNMTVDNSSRAVIQEDPGAQDYLAKLHAYDIGSRSLRTLAEHDPARFAPGAPGFLTRDEESSGIIDISHILGERGSYLINVQAHYNIGDPELVEGGQLLVMHARPVDTTPPVITFTEPLNQQTVAGLTTIRGTALDEQNGSGLRNVQLVIMRYSDGTYWNGSGWAPFGPNAILETVVNATAGTWAYNNGPSGVNLQNGPYRLQATAFDNAGNAALTAIGVTVSPSRAGHILSGRITRSGGGVAQGVQVALQNASGDVVFTTTDANGNYRFEGVKSGNFLVRPVSQTLVFSPPTRFDTLSNSDITTLDFIAAPGS